MYVCRCSLRGQLGCNELSELCRGEVAELHIKAVHIPFLKFKIIFSILRKCNHLCLFARLELSFPVINYILNVYLLVDPHYVYLNYIHIKSFVFCICCLSGPKWTRAWMLFFWSTCSTLVHTHPLKLHATSTVWSVGLLAAPLGDS